MPATAKLIVTKIGNNCGARANISTAITRIIMRSSSYYSMADLGFRSGEGASMSQTPVFFYAKLKNKIRNLRKGARRR